MATQWKFKAILRLASVQYYWFLRCAPPELCSRLTATLFTQQSNALCGELEH